MHSMHKGSSHKRKLLRHPLLKLRLLRCLCQESVIQVVHRGAGGPALHGHHVYDSLQSFGADPPRVPRRQPAHLHPQLHPPNVEGTPLLALWISHTAIWQTTQAPQHQLATISKWTMMP